VAIVLLSEVFPPQKGGSGRWLSELYRRLPLDVHVVAADVPNAAVFDATAPLPIARIPLIFANWGVLTRQGLSAYWRAMKALAPIVRRVRPQAIHCGKALPEGLIALACRLRWRVPYCCFVHGEELRLAHTSRDLHWLTHQVLRRARLIVANSAHTERVLRTEWGLSQRIAIMHPGVDASTFVPAAPNAAVRARLGWTDRRVVLTVGALQQRKGQDMLIRALPAIRVKCPDVLYVIAGEGWERAALEGLVDELNVRDHVQFIEVPADPVLVDCYQQCDVFVLPNRQVGWDIEGFGIVLLEAQACGKAVVAGRSGGTSETMRPGMSGELVACETPEPLAEAVVALLNDPERRGTMGAAGREWVVSTFDWPVLERRAMDLFARALV
jgi:phosphatidyl-myo-inositol dimannoside synthase